MKLLCDRNPQTEDGKRLFLLFNVTGEGQLGEDGAEIYLPYSYFDLTAEAGMALAAKGVRPLIRHYLNENCTEKESLLGEYTAAGVRIVTRSFSPFLIDANGCTVGDLNGDDAVDTLDMRRCMKICPPGAPRKSWRTRTTSACWPTATATVR